MAVGAFAGIYHGINRTTDDADFVIQVEHLDLTKLRRELEPQFANDSAYHFACACKIIVLLGSRFSHGWYVRRITASRY